MKEPVEHLSLSDIEAPFKNLWWAWMLMIAVMLFLEIIRESREESMYGRR